MALTTILRRSASTIAPLAARFIGGPRNNHHYSSMFSGVKHSDLAKKIIPNFSPFLSMQHCSSYAAVNRPSSSESRVIDSEIQGAEESEGVEVGEVPAGDLIFRKSCSSPKDSSNSSEFLSYMGGLDSEQKQLINKLVNFRMKEGKKNRVRTFLYQTFHRLALTDRDVIKLMVDAMENIKPVCEVKKVRRARTIYDVPAIVSKNRQQTLAIRWILEGAFKRRMSHRISLEKCLFDEIVDAYRKRGNARKKRETLHELASNRRSFARFRWW